MQMIKNVGTLGGVHTHTSNLETRKININIKSNTNKPIVT